MGGEAVRPGQRFGNAPGNKGGAPVLFALREETLNQHCHVLRVDVRIQRLDPMAVTLQVERAQGP